MLFRKVRTNPARCTDGIYQDCVVCSAWPERDGRMGDKTLPGNFRALTESSFD